ncbi:PorV/PorQ family protein [candidate division KSB1 bacterium]
MRKYFKIEVIILLFLILFFVNGKDFSAEPGFEFLMNEVGARPAALAGAFVGIEGDLNSIFYNPAGIATLKNKTGTITYLNHLLDINAGVVGYAQPVLNRGVLGIGINYLNYGDLEGRTEEGFETGTFGAYDYAVTLSYADKVFNNIKAGISAKFINSKIENYSASAVALDLGFIYRIEKHKANIGFSLINIGSSTKAFIETKESLPSQIKGGFSKELAHLPVILSIEIRRFNDNKFQYLGGGEIIFNDKIKGRFGYNSNGKDQHFGITDDTFAGFSLGLGFAWREFNLDYAFSSMGGIGSQNRFTLTREF